MTKTKLGVPSDVPTLHRWLGQDPKAHLKELEGAIAKGATFERLAEPARIGLKWAWDEQPDVFFPLITPWLKGTNARLRRVAAGALPVSNPDQREKCVRLLKGLITDKDRDVRLTAIDLLAEDVVHQLDLIKRWAKDEDPAVRAVVVRHLQPVDVETLKQVLPLVEALAKDPHPDVHWAAATTLHELYDREPRGVLEVARAMADSPDESTRLAVASCFFEHVFADHFDALLPTLRAWLRGSSPELRWTLARSLRFLRITPRSLQLLRALYEDKEPEIRRRILLVILDLYEPRVEHRRALADLLHRAREDSSKRVRDVLEEGEARFGAGFELLALEGADDGSAYDDFVEEGEEGASEESEEDDDF